MALNSYSTGTIAIAAGGTIVTAVGASWTGVNARSGDTLIVAGHEVGINDITDSLHLTIDAWPFAAVVAGTGYKIRQDSPLRFVGGQFAADQSTMLTALNDLGPIFNVAATATVPDPSYGKDSQYAHQMTTNKWWLKTAGAWAPSNPPASPRAIIRHSNAETAYAILSSDIGCRLIATNNTAAMTWTLGPSTGDFANGELEITNAGIAPLFISFVGTKYNVFDSVTGIGYIQLALSQHQTAKISPDNLGGNWIADILQTSKSNGYEKTHDYISYSLSNGGPFFSISGTPTIGNIIGFDYSYDITPGGARNTLSFRYTFTTNTVAELAVAAKNLETQIKFNATLNTLLGPDNAQYFVCVQTAPLPNPAWLLAMNQVWPFNPNNHPSSVVFNSVGHTVTIAMLNDIGSGATVSNLDIGSWITMGRGTRYAGREPTAGDRIAGIFITGETTGNSINGHDYQPIYGSLQWTVTNPTPGVAGASLFVSGESVTYGLGNFATPGSATFNVGANNAIGAVTINGGLLNVNANFTGIGGVAVPNGTIVAIEGPDTGPGAFINIRAFNGGAPAIVMQTTRGTGGAPLATDLGDVIGSFSFGGYNGAASFTQSASISASATELFTATHSGSQINFYTTLNGTNALTRRGTIGNGGQWLVAGAAAPNVNYAFDINNNAVSSASGLGATTARFVAADGVNTIIEMSTVGGSAGSIGNAFRGLYAGGTLAGPTVATGVGNIMHNFTGYAHDGTNYAASAAYQMLTTQTFTGAAHGSKHVWYNTPNGSITLTLSMTLHQSGGLAVGSTTPDPGLGGIGAGGGIFSYSSTAGIGYKTGAGGAIVQATSRATAVTINKPSGSIQLFSAAAAGAWNSFTVNNNTVGANDTVTVAQQQSAGNTYFTNVTNVQAGSFVLWYFPIAGSATDTPIFNFNVHKGTNN